MPPESIGLTGRMRCGVFVVAARFPGQDDGAVLARAVEVARAADKAGFDDAWIAEHHFMSYGTCPDAATLAAYLLGVTRRLDVGTAVSVLSNRHPVTVAEQAALLDQVSGGRFRLGVGRGGPWVDLEVFGTGLARYERGFAESLDLLLAWLTRERVAGDGPTFRFRPVSPVPRPRTRPHPPIVVACTSPSTEAVAAARGLPMLLGLHISDQEKAAAVARYADTAAAHGHDAHPPHVAAAVAYVADSRAEARRTLEAAMPGWLGPGLAGYTPVDDRPPPRRDPHAYTRMLCDLHPVGDPDDCVESIVTTVEQTGVGHLILLVECAGDRARTLENVARLGTEVLPRVRAHTAPVARRHPPGRPRPPAGRDRDEHRR